MRNAFAAEITAYAEMDSRLVLLSGDIGNRLFDLFKAQFPDRFYNCGVAEANMIGVAAGLALGGLKPVAYTIAPFVTSRCFEQIKLDVCQQNLPVVIVGIGAGLAYASLNPTHHTFEDIACLRALPNLSIICPGDAWEVRAALRAALRHNGPVYIRIGKKNEPLIHPETPALEIGQAIVIQPGADICLLSTGAMLPVAVVTAANLAQQGISAQVVSFHTVKPLDEALLSDVFARFALVATLEEHSLIGGLGSSVAEWLADRAPQRARLARFGLADAFMDRTGNQQFARARFGLTAENIAFTIINFVKDITE